MTEAVISEFALLGALSVISRTSVMQYKDARKPLPEIAQELGVQGVVEGSVFRAGDRVRITLQLIDARNDLHLWAQTYERDLRDVLALQSDVARAVAEQIHLKLTRDEERALTASRTVDPKAYDAYLRGLQLWGPTRLVGVWGPPAIKQLERAVERDPHFAEGWAELARAQVRLGIGGRNLRYRPQLAKAQKAAQQALEIDDRLGAAHAMLAEARFWYDWDFPGARRAYERALQLSPSDPGVLNSYAWFLLLVSAETEQVLDLSERLLRVAPLDLFWRSERVGHFYTIRQYERALEEVERVRLVDPDFVNWWEVWSYAGLQRGTLERGWEEGGWKGSQRAWIEMSTEIEGSSPFLIAAVSTWIGETEEAFAWLERGYRERDPLMVLTKAEPVFDPLRSDPRFDDLLRRIGFPEE
jgi:hypothetical protein